MNDLHRAVNDTPAASAVRPPMKLLIPIDGSDRARWGLQYARIHARRGDELAAELLFVAEPIRNWQVLRFWTRQEISRFQAERGRFLLDDAERKLREAGIDVNTHYREGDAAYQIFEAAQALQCQEIVLPAPESFWMSGLNRNLALEIQERLQSVRVITVDASGLPCADGRMHNTPNRSASRHTGSN